jgi:hypothetical protein
MKKQNKKGGSDKAALKTLSDIKKAVRELGKPENLTIIKYIKPNNIPLDPVARLKCFQCG